MGVQLRITAAAVALTLLAQAASAQDEPQGNKVILPPIDVSSSRLGGGITGSSTTIISSEDLQRAPESTLQDILSREAGIQTTSLYGGVNGTGTTVDMRGFGVTAPSNVLVLVDGRRFNDSDLTGFDFSLIPRNSIDHIEITRGNSGAVLYGDGAVGGVINIVTKNGVGAKPNARIEGAFARSTPGKTRFRPAHLTAHFRPPFSAMLLTAMGIAKTTKQSRVKRLAICATKPMKAACFSTSRLTICARICPARAI
jgi:iron complex outermembrane receptor protein